MRKLIPLLFLFFAVNGIAAYFPLQETFFLDDLKSLTLEETASTQPTPSSGKTKLYVKNGELTILDDAGTETAVGTVSDHNDTTNIQGGTTDEYYHLTNTQHNEVTTEIDPVYIKNGGAEQALSGWSCSSNVTITRNTTTPLKGAGDFDLDVTSSAVAGNYCQYAFTATNADMETKMLTASIDAIKYIGTYNNGDIRVCVYDVTAAKCLRTDFFFDTSPKFSADFQIETNSSLALRFEVVTPSVARELRLEGISVKPQVPSVIGLAGWKQYDIASYLTVTGLTSGTWTTTRARAVPYKTLDGVWRVKLNIRGSVTSVARTGADIEISGLTFSTEQAISTGGYHAASQSGDSRASSSSIFIRHASETTDSYWVSGDVELTSKPTWAVDYSNVKLSSQESGREVSFIGTSTSSASISTAAKISFDSEIQDTTNSYSSGSFTVPEDGTYRFSGAITYGAAPALLTTIAYLVKNGSGVLQSQMGIPAGASYGAPFNFDYPCKKGEIFEIWAFNSSATNMGGGSTYLSITKLNTGSQTLAKDAFVFEKYDTSSSLISASTSSGVAIFTNMVRSTHGAYNTSTGKFKAPRDGIFEVCTSVRHDTNTMSSAFGGLLLTGGDGVSTADYNKTIGSFVNATTLKSNGCQTFSASINEEAWIVPFHPNATGTQALNGSAQQNWVTWRSLD